MKRIIILFVIFVTIAVFCEDTEHNVVYLEPGDTISHYPVTRRVGFFATELKIYCYRGCEKSLGQIFQTVELRLEIENDDFIQYDGGTAEIVRERHAGQKSIFSLSSLLSTKKTRLKLNPFNQTCTGIETIQPYRLRLQLIRVDFWRVIQITLGILFFWNAARLSQNSLFYYLSGILLGIFASFLVLIYMASKLVPRKPMMYGVLVGGWTVAIYFGQMLWENLQMILVTYKTYVFWYVLLTGFTSFVICYRLGPPTNERSRNIIKWGLQLASLVVIFYSSDYQEATAATNILIVLAYYFPRPWLYRLRSMYARRFPPRPKLLSTEEYYEQGVRETTKALEELRQYCGSPECHQWRMVGKLKDPLRFASFMEGSSHLMDDEILEYETSRADISDVSESSGDEEEADGDERQQDNVDNGAGEDISEDEDEEVAGGRALSRSIKSVNGNSYSKLNGSIERRQGIRGRMTYSYATPSTRNPGSAMKQRSYRREYSDED